MVAEQYLRIWTVASKPQSPDPEGAKVDQIAKKDSAPFVRREIPQGLKKARQLAMHVTDDQPGQAGGFVQARTGNDTSRFSAQPTSQPRSYSAQRRDRPLGSWRHFCDRNGHSGPLWRAFAAPGGFKDARLVRIESAYPRR